MSCYLEVIRPPTEPAVSLDTAKAHLRMDGNDEDALVQRLVQVATQQVEQLCHRTLLSQGFALTLDRFPAWNTPILIPRPPLQSIDSIQYVGQDGADYSLADYALFKNTQYTDLCPSYGGLWPITRAQRGAVRIEFTAGYGTADDIPAPLIQAILLLVGHLDQSREAVVIGASPATLLMGVEALIAPYVVPSQV